MHLTGSEVNTRTHMIAAKIVGKTFLEKNTELCAREKCEQKKEEFSLKKYFSESEFFLRNFFQKNETMKKK